MSFFPNVFLKPLRQNKCQIIAIYIVWTNQKKKLPPSAWVYRVISDGIVIDPTIYHNWKIKISEKCFTEMRARVI